MPTFDQVNIVSGDLRASAEFYRRLGFEVAEPFANQAGEAFHTSYVAAPGVNVDLDSPTFARIWNQGWAGTENLRGRVVLGMRVERREEVDAKYAAITDAGYRGLQAPFDAFWGARYAIVEDPDGLAIGIMSIVDEARRTPPPGM